MLTLLIVGPLLVIGIATLLILRAAKATGESNAPPVPPPPGVSSPTIPASSNPQPVSPASNQQLEQQVTAQQAQSSPDAGVPNLAQLRAFGEKIADGWFGASGEKDPFGYVHHHVVRDILKNSTNSLIHPTVWTIVVDEMDDQGRQSTVNFNFYWNGRRLVASPSTGMINSGSASSKVDIDQLDDLAKKIQSQ
jgi:hypothetical protein